MSRGKLIVIVAPSGTGKSTLLERVQGECPTLEWSVSCTTRKIRPGEVDGEDYKFISVKEFLTRKDNNEFVEWAEVHSNYYGTLKTFIDEGLNNGKHLLFDLDVQGCDLMRDIYGDEANIIFIQPPSVEALEGRLRARGTETDETIALRLSNAKSELQRADDFNYKVINDDIDKAYIDLKVIIDKILR